MTPFFNPGPNPYGDAQDLPRRRRRADDRGRRRGVRRLPLPRLHHRALPPRGHAPGARARAGPRPARRWRASRSSGPSFVVTGTNDEEMDDGRRRAPASRSRSTARRPPTGACSSCTAGAACRTSSTRCRSRASGWRWATLIDDEILNTFAVVGEPEQIAPELHKPLRRRRRPHQLLRAVPQRPRALARRARGA